MMYNPKILLANCDNWIEDTALLLRHNKGYDTIVYTDGKRLLRDLPELDYHLGFLSVNFPELENDLVIRLSKELNPDVPVIGFSAYIRGTERAHSIADMFLQVPFEMNELYQAIRKLLGDSRKIGFN
jgi:DNA-binding response OmpR family regulator